MKKLISSVVLCFVLVCLSSCTHTEYDLFSNIAGTVVDKSTGEPLGQVDVTLKPLMLKTYTGSDGQFYFNDIEATDDYEIWVQKDGYRANNIKVKAPSGETINVSITMEKL